MVFVSSGSILLIHYNSACLLIVITIVLTYMPFVQMIVLLDVLDQSWQLLHELLKPVRISLSFEVQYLSLTLFFVNVIIFPCGFGRVIGMSPSADVRTLYFPSSLMFVLLISSSTHVSSPGPRSCIWCPFFYLFLRCSLAYWHDETNNQLFIFDWTENVCIIGLKPPCQPSTCLSLCICR